MCMCESVRVGEGGSGSWGAEGKRGSWEGIEASRDLPATAPAPGVTNPPSPAPTAADRPRAAPEEESGKGGGEGAGA